MITSVASMRPLTFAISPLLLILAALPAPGETLAEAAAREAARRQQKVAKKAPVYTEGELARAGTSGTFNVMTGPQEKSPPAATGATPPVRRRDASPDVLEDEADRRGGRTEAEWRSQAALLHEAIRELGEEVKMREKTIGGAAERRLVCEDGPQCANPRLASGNPAQMLFLARERLRQAQDALEALEDEARRLSVPPGWLRER